MKKKFNINNINLSVKKLNTITKEESEKIKRAKLYISKKIEVWTAIGTNNELSYATHGLIRFFGKFPPPIARYLIEKYTNKNSLVIDPMGGSGTTALECLLKSRKCYSFDVNPLMILLQTVKIQKISEKEINKILENIKKKYKPISFKKNINKFVGLKNPQHFFLGDTLDSLMGLKVLIDKIDNIKIKNFFIVCFLSIIRRVSRATSQQGRLFLDVDTAEKNVLPFFIKKIERFKKRVNDLPARQKPITIKQKNILDKNLFKSYFNKADLVILHPPYFNSYKYSSITSLETFWMNIDHATIRKNEVREFFKIGKPENHKKFVSDMSITLNNAMDMLKKGGHLAFMMGDSIIKGQYIELMKKTLDQAKIKKTQIKTIALRVPKFTEASWASSQRRLKNAVGIDLNDFVILIKKI